MVDLMGLLSDALIGSFQMLMLNDLGKNMFPYRIKTCWKRILIYGVTALVILGVNHIESTFINIMMVPVSYTIAAIVIFQGSVWLIAIAVIFLLSPVDTGHKRLDEKERKVYGKSARKLLIIEFVLAFCFGETGILIVAKGIAVAHIILASGLILGKSQNFFENKLGITNL